MLNDRSLGGYSCKYHSGQAELIIIYGRRRVGKTALIREFLHNKPHIYFAANLDTDAQLLSTFSKLIVSTVHPEKEAAADFSYQSWQEAFIFWLRVHPSND
ncbi:hypothetical protein KFU94_55935 [Chloroflexi bacterium TSY]|nr:hypothetical protein [Chloroflexi bacterium TSY]